VNPATCILGCSTLALATALTILTSRFLAQGEMLEQLGQRAEAPTIAGNPQANARACAHELTAPTATATLEPNRPDADEHAKELPEPTVEEVNLAMQIARRAEQEELLRDPRYRQLRLQREVHTLWRVHGDAIASTRLPPKVAQALVELLAQHQLEQVEHGTTAARDAQSDGVHDDGGASLADIQRQQREQRQAAEIETLLGTAKYQDWTNFHQTKLARYQVTLLEKSAESVGEPLRPEQRTALVGLLTDVPNDAAAANSGGGARKLETSPRQHLAALEHEVDQVSRANRYLQQMAASYLTPRQLEIYMSMLNRNLERAKAEAELQRATMELLDAGDRG
jgi:hypothetical protein